MNTSDRSLLKASILILLCLLLAVCVVWLLQPFEDCAAQAESIPFSPGDYVTLSELRKQTPARWTQTYQTKWRTIEIDVQPTLPSVGAVPIVKVSPDLSTPDISVLGAGWDCTLSDMGIVYINSLQEGGESEYLRIEKERQGKTVSTNYYAPYDMNHVYAENSDVTLQEVLNELRELLIKLGYNPQDWAFESPKFVLCNKLIDKSGEYLFPGVYTVKLYQSLLGIPLYRRGSSKEQETSWDTGLLFSRFTAEAMSVAWHRVKIIDVMTDDVPLCDFSTVKGSIETLINQGHIRRIFDVELGYVLYNEPGTEYGVPRDKSKLSEAIYYAVPVWKVNCYYVENAKKELRDYSNLDVPERAVMEYYSLLFDAQTGVFIDNFNTRKGDGAYKGFISWEDVQ